jgi:hypothetical protein
MTKFKAGDKVKVIDANEDGKNFIGKIGRVIPPQGSGYEVDLVFVKVEGYPMKGFLEHQLERLE